MKNTPLRIDMLKGKQGEVISVELYNRDLNQYIKEEYVIISRNEYNCLTTQFLACKINYTNKNDPYLIHVNINGLRRNSKVNTLNIYTLNLNEDANFSYDLLGEISYMGFCSWHKQFL